ncbi:hypothetical protein D8Y20_08615 [Mariprofundus sp. EBB-1]|uniref:hypothetical protein n=1 Tax=Mariprofundus sp. EBB-1 TaxID=2650971 RepID=UPI000EF21953|nr:hypothetical protein [Mariprofundus sp. EBB-1]RLL51740.1 hypothetical protein D8Y20_08615 [Mariprofundus sp. EBB-1]
MNIAVYISGHGFGHLAQMAPVLNRLHRIRPDISFLLRCALPEQEMRSRLHFPFEREASPVDVGVVQKNAVEEDRHASIKLMRAWIEQMDAQIDKEIALLRAFNPALILSDISPLAFPVAKALGIPGIGLATLDWHSIYSYWLDADDPIITTLASAYAQCDLLLTPPMAMHMPVFATQQQIPLIFTQANSVANPVATDTRKKALVLFGGCGNPPYHLHALQEMHEWLFLVPDMEQDPSTNLPGNVQPVRFASDLRPVDLMPHVDVVLCKPGYGILSECWTTETPIAWVERPDFPEFPMLKEWLDNAFPACGMSRADFQQGHWQVALDAARIHPTPFPEYEDGAIKAADIILSYGS